MMDLVFFRVPIVSSSCPSLFLVKIACLDGIFCAVVHMFRKTGSTVNWFTHCWLERDHRVLPAFCTFDLEHTSLCNYNHL